jgi:predicted nucleic acid-binding protein
MSLLYLDASALVKRYVHEPGSTWVRTLIDDPANVILISAISLVEVSAAIAICVRIGKLGPRQGGTAYEEFSDELASTTSGRSPSRLSNRQPS